MASSAGPSPSRPISTNTTANVGDESGRESIDAVADASSNVFNMNRDKCDETLKGMEDEALRMIKLVRELQRQIEHLISESQKKTEDSAEVRTKTNVVEDVVTAVLNQIPAQYLPAGSDGKDPIARLKDAIDKLVKDANEVEDELAKAKDQVSGVNRDMEKMRNDGEKLKKLLDDSVHRLRDVIQDPNGKMSLADLIEAMRQLLDEEQKAKENASKALELEKKEVDEMLDRRRRMHEILKKLFERCGAVDRLTKDLGLESVIACPMEVDEKKQMAVEFERGIGWLTGQMGNLITELRSARQRLSESRDKLEQAEKDSKKAADQLGKCKEDVEKLQTKSDALKKEWEKAKNRNDQARKEDDEIRVEFDGKVKEVMEKHESKKSEWHKMALELGDASERIRRELAAFSQDLTLLRSDTSKLVIRIDTSLKEYADLKDKFLGDGKNGDNGQRIRQKDARIRKLHADSAALDAETKEAEREAEEWLDELNEAKGDMKRRSEWRDGAKTRLDKLKGRRDKNEPELAASKEQADQLQEKIKSNAQKLDLSNGRARHVQSHLTDLGRRIRELQEKNQQLRWEREQGSPVGDERMSGEPCRTCAQNEEVMARLPALKQERDQLVEEKKDLEDRKDKVKKDLEKRKDGKVEKRLLREPSSTASDDASQSPRSEEPPRSEMLGTSNSPAIRKVSSLPKPISGWKGQKQTYRRSSSRHFKSSGGIAVEESLNLVVNANVVLEGSEYSTTTTDTASITAASYDATESTK